MTLKEFLIKYAATAETSKGVYVTSLGRIRSRTLLNDENFLACPLEMASRKQGIEDIYLDDDEDNILKHAIMNAADHAENLGSTVRAWRGILLKVGEVKA